MEQKLLERDLYRGKTKTIHNFIEQQSLNTELKKENYILYFGRLSEEKGFEMFLNCCKRLSHIPVIIAGTGPMDKMCQGISNVTFVGFKTGQELNDLIQKAKFSVYPSIWYENCPLSVLESESLGTPVIASKMGGIPELVEHGETGILVDPITEENLYNAIRELYDNRELVNQMSQNCRNKRNQMISLNEYCDKLVTEYAEVIKSYRH